MKISELIESSARIRSMNTEGHYAASYVFSNKELGQPLQFNKTVLYKPNSSIVEIGMYITAVTEKGKSGHFCQIALRGIQMEAKSAEEVFEKVRSRQGGKMAEADEDEIRDYIAAGNTVYNNKYVVQSRNNNNVYLVMDRNISPDTECKVKCSCASFLFDVSWYNAKAGCLIGKAMPYPKHAMNVGGTTTTVRNIDKVPGLCKHLMLLVSLLMKEGFIEGGTDDITAYVQGGGSLPKSRGRLSTAKANYYIEQTMKQYRAQTKMINALSQGKFNVKQGAIRGTQVGKYLASVGKMNKEAHKAKKLAQKQKNVGSQFKPKSPIKKRKKKK